MRDVRLTTGTALVVACLVLAGCNPTWTTKGKPNNNAMPMPPGARPVPAPSASERLKASDEAPPANQAAASPSVG